MQLKPTDGHIIAGAAISDNVFIGRLPEAQLFQLAPDPRDTENRRKVDESRLLQGQYSVRQEVQRLFEGRKKKNVAAYARYIADAKAGKQQGITPPMILYNATKLPVQENEDGTAFIQIPWGEWLVAIDGETQLAARHEASNLNPDTRSELVGVYICHGLSRDWARQAFHDLNTLAVRPNAALAIGMDARDPLTAVAREVEHRVPFFKGRVNKVRRQLRTSDAEIVTITSLRGACVTVAKGINGVQYGARPVPVDESMLPYVEVAAVDWFSAVADAIGPTLEDRVNKLAASPASLAAIGAIGSQIVSIDDDAERAAKARQLASNLAGVNWERGQRWEGIAGKFTPRGAFAVGGAKETAYAIYSALTDPTDPGFKAIRAQSKRAA